MDNEFDQQASKILRENLEGSRWSDEYDIKEVTSTDDLEDADRGDAFLFDDVDEFAQGEEEVIETERDVMDFLSRFGVWELKDNPYGAIVVKTGDILRMQPPGDEEVIKDAPSPPTTDPNDPNYYPPIVP